MRETNSPLVAHVGYDISSLSRVKFKKNYHSPYGFWITFYIQLSWVEKYSNPQATEGESIYHSKIICTHTR